MDVMERGEKMTDERLWISWYLFSCMDRWCGGL